MNEMVVTAGPVGDTDVYAMASHVGTSVCGTWRGRRMERHYVECVHAAAVYRNRQKKRLR